MHLLTEEHCGSRSPYLSKAFRKGRKKARRRFSNTNIVGIGFGLKETNDTFTGDLAVRVYVSSKLPLADIPKRYRIPEVVNGLLTDVIPLDQPMFQTRPVFLGASIGHVNGDGGSLGCLVSLEGDQDLFVLSACHVLALGGSANLGDSILEPPRLDHSATPIATLAAFEPLKSNGADNRFDAAVARLISRSDVHPSFETMGNIQADVIAPWPGESVKKYGAATQETFGTVADISAETAFPFEADEILFTDLIQVRGNNQTRFSEGGDSGSLVVDDATNRPVGLVIGGTAFRTFLSPLGPVLTRFKARIKL